MRTITKINQDFFIIKQHLNTCETRDQVESVCDWINNLVSNWDSIMINEMRTLSKKKAERLNNDTIELLSKTQEEFTNLTNQKLSEIEPEKINPEHVVVVGFC